MRSDEVNSVHAVVDYLLTSAGMTGKTKKVQVRIPHRDLVPESEEYDDIDLIITIETNWEQTKDGEQDFTEIETGN